MTRLLLLPIVLLVVLSGCGEDEPDPQVSAVDEVFAHPGAVCPRTLVDPEDEHGFGTEAPADEGLDLPAAEAAWVCRYDPGDGGRSADGTRYTWVLAGGEHEVPDEALASLDDLLAEMEPAEPHRMCTADLGPRWMLVHRVGDDLTSIVVDDYGCRDVRVTDDPFTTPPGEATQPGTVSGVLSAPEGFVDRLRELAGP